MTRYRFHHTYRSGFWGVAWGIDRLANSDHWFIHLGRKVWVFARPLTASKRAARAARERSTRRRDRNQVTIND